jgi:FkbM family methyltransferase
LVGLESFIDVTAFEADPEEADRLNAAPHRYHHFEALPYFVGDRLGDVGFYIYRSPGDSSSRLPNPVYQDLFRNLEVAREITVNSTTLDRLAEDDRLGDADFIKLDTQGTEYEILTCANRVLEHALMVEVEVEFVEMYLGQKLAFDIEKLMHDKGFDLLFLNRVFVGRIDYDGPTRGQLSFADALFGLRFERALELPIGKLVRYIVLLVQYGHIDTAYALYSDAPGVKEAYPELASSFRFYGGVVSKGKRFCAMQLDKLIAYVLYLRGTNQLRTDSDRSWPIR